MVERDYITFFEAARNDLKAAECLYNNGYYSQAIFCLEQAVEKIVKSIGLYTKLVTKEEFGKDVGHNVEKIYSRMVEKTREKWGDFIPIPPLKPIKNRRELLDTAFDEIKFEKWFFQLKKIEDIYRIVDILLNTAEIISDKEPNKQIETIKTSFKSFLEIIKETEGPKAVERAKYNLKLYFSFSQELVKLYQLSEFLVPHVSVSRYPDDKNGYGPHSYTEETPIIQNFPELVDLVKGSFELLEKFYGKEGVE